MYDERVRGFPPRVWRRWRHAAIGAAHLRYRRGGDRQATDAASDLLQRLTTTTTTTTTTAPLFRASRCVRCRRCSRCPLGMCMSPRWTATTGRGVLRWSVVTTHRCGAPSSHCSRMRPRRRRHCCRMHMVSRRQSISRCPPRFCSDGTSTAHHLCSTTWWLENWTLRAVAHTVRFE